MNEIKVIAFTHKSTDISNIGRLHIEESNRKERLHRLFNLGVSELLYLSTCNRVEFVLVNGKALDQEYLYSFFAVFNPDWDDQDIKWAIQNCETFEGSEAVKHVFKVASSLDSLVIGEREIITQVRKAFDDAVEMEFIGHNLRLLINKTIETAKEVYTKTNIARNPVSIVSLAYRTLREVNMQNESRVLIIGAGETNTNMCKFLHKHGFSNFTVFNRTLEKGQLLADSIGGNALPLSELSNYNKGFDLLVTCTGSEDHIVTSEIYANLLQGESTKKVLIDLAIPYDVDPTVVKNNNVNYIGIEGLKSISEKNLEARGKEVNRCLCLIEQQLIAFKQAFKERQVELAMQDVPRKIKEIKELAMTEVFAKEMEALEDEHKVVLEKVLAYIEKKYISVPMKLAKEILLDQAPKNNG